MRVIAKLLPEFHEWVRERPERVQKLIARLPPNVLYTLGTVNCRIHSYSEDGTVTVNISEDDNPGDPLLIERQVFGVKPEDLT